MEKGKQGKEKEKEGAIEWRDDRLFYFPLPENPFRTHARSIEDISQTSPSNTDIAVVHPIHPFGLSLPHIFNLILLQCNAQTLADHTHTVGSLNYVLMLLGCSPGPPLPNAYCISHSGEPSGCNPR